MVQAKKLIFDTEVSDELNNNNLQIVTEEIPEVEEGEFLVEAALLSLDPEELNTENVTTASVLKGHQVGKILESKNEDFPVDSLVIGPLGWRTHTVVNSTNDQVHLIQTNGIANASAFLGPIGHSGTKAYIALLKILQPQPEQTIVISGAANATASYVSQIAKILGCKVVVVDHGEEKLNWLSRLGFDDVLDSKSENFEEELKNATSDGVDYFYDTVGGLLLNDLVKRMNKHGKILIAGVDSEALKVPVAGIQDFILNKTLTIQGYSEEPFADCWDEAKNANLEWVREGKIQYKENIANEGFDEHLPKTVISLLKDSTFGENIVDVNNFKYVLRRFKKLTTLN